MYNLKMNFDKFFDIVKLFFKNDLNADDNSFFYPKKAKDEPQTPHYISSQQ